MDPSRRRKRATSNSHRGCYARDLGCSWGCYRAHPSTRLARWQEQANVIQYRLRKREGDRGGTRTDKSRRQPGDAPRTLKPQAAPTRP
eukprot:5016946-Pyramimonas_sp.AAC.1